MCHFFNPHLEGHTNGPLRTYSKYSTSNERSLQDSGLQQGCFGLSWVEASDMGAHGIFADVN